MLSKQNLPNRLNIASDYHLYLPLYTSQAPVKQNGLLVSAPFCPWAFAHAVSSLWKAFPSCLTSNILSSFKTLLRCHLLSSALSAVPPKAQPNTALPPFHLFHDGHLITTFIILQGIVVSVALPPLVSLKDSSGQGTSLDSLSPLSGV